MPQKSNGLRVLDGGTTPDGYTVRAELDIFDHVRVIKSRDTDRAREGEPGAITFYPRIRPILSAIAGESLMGGPGPGVYNPDIHNIGMVDALTVLRGSALQEGWTHEQHLALKIIENKIIHPIANVPRGFDLLRFTIDMGIQATGYELSVRRGLSSGVEIVQKRRAGTEQSADHPDFQTFSSDKHLRASNDTSSFGHTGGVRSTETAPANSQLFIDTLANHADELIALAENTPAWSLRSCENLSWLLTRVTGSRPVAGSPINRDSAFDGTTPFPLGLSDSPTGRNW